MNAKLLKRRKAAVNRHDVALERWPNRNDPDFIEELEGVISELEEIIGAADKIGGDRAERSRSWMYLGMAHFDLGMAYSKLDKNSEANAFTESAIAYENSERLLLGIGDPMQAATLNFNYANTLRGLSEGENVKLLEAAKERYQLALETFQKKAPRHAAQVSATLSTLDNQLNLAKLKTSVGKKVSRFEKLQEKIRQAGSKPTPEEQEEIQEEFRKVRDEGPDIPSIIDIMNREAQGVLKELNQKVPEESIAAVQEQLNRISRLFDKASQSKPASESDLDTRFFSALMERFEAEVQSGKITATRHKALKPILNELRDLINNKPEEIGELMDWTARMRALAKTMTYLLAKPSVGKPEPPSGSRASKILALWVNLKINLTTDLNRPHLSSEEKKRGTELLVRCSNAEQSIYDAGSDDSSTNTLEAELLRSLALEVRGFLLRNHIMLTNPFWGSKSVARHPNAVFFSGGPDAEKIISDVCKKRSLHLLPTPTGVNFAQARWTQLLSSNIAVFDLSVEPGPNLAAVCYELGIARSLGKSVAVIRMKKQKLPFDVDVTPIILNARKDDLKSCAEGLDRALFIYPYSVPGSSVKDTVATVKQIYGSNEYGFEVEQALKFLEDAKEDAILTQRRLMSLLGLLPSDVPMILYPTWHPYYPKTDETRCFHVMPFSEKWSDQVSQISKGACKTARVSYIRGDEVSDPKIIHSIWEEICKASHVLVDMTGFNANVALELGIAHTLGRKTLIMGQPDTVNRLFPMISKTRINTYDLKDDSQSLKDSVVRFVST